jgi:hypothetical protein
LYLLKLFVNDCSVLYFWQLTHLSIRFLFVIYTLQQCLMGNSLLYVWSVVSKCREKLFSSLWRILTYKRGNKKPYFVQGQTMQWPYHTRILYLLKLFVNDCSVLYFWQLTHLSIRFLLRFVGNIGDYDKCYKTNMVDTTAYTSGVPMAFSGIPVAVFAEASTFVGRNIHIATMSNGKQFVVCVICCVQM